MMTVASEKIGATAARLPVICLLGPTASGKTPLAIQLVQRLPCEIISVDSAMVYRGMDIGTAKPDAATLQRAPHRLIDIREPTDPYSAGDFRSDVLREMAAIHAQPKIPLLVGGTMLYFRVLQHGLATLPKADAAMRAALTLRLQTQGLAALHAELAAVDAAAAARIHVNDEQRILRALEVHGLTGSTISAWQKTTASASLPYQFYNVALIPADRKQLHQRIAERFDAMLQQGFMMEMQRLVDRGDLSAALPAMRSVGYRQAYAHLTGKLSYTAMRETAIAATRQLAKRQLTWLRSWPNVIAITAEGENKAAEVERKLSGIF